MCFLILEINKGSECFLFLNNYIANNCNLLNIVLTKNYLTLFQIMNDQDLWNLTVTWAHGNLNNTRFRDTRFRDTRFRDTRFRDKIEIEQVNKTNMSRPNEVIKVKMKILKIKIYEIQQSHESLNNPRFREKI